MERFMKYIFLALALLIPNSFVLANDYSLCGDSKLTIAGGAVAGAAILGMLGLGAVYLADDKTSSNQDQSASTWELIKKYKGFLVASVIAGALTGGYIGYLNTPEYTLDSTTKFLNDLEMNNPVIQGDYELAADSFRYSQKNGEQASIYLPTVFLDSWKLNYKLTHLKDDLQKLITVDSVQVRDSAEVVLKRVNTCLDKLSDLELRMRGVSKSVLNTIKFIVQR